MNEIVVALIGAGTSILASILTLVGVVINNNKSNAKIERNLEVKQAVTDTKIDELTREVREHNNFALRVPVLEQEIIDIKADIKHLKQYHSERI